MVACLICDAVTLNPATRPRSSGRTARSLCDNLLLMSPPTQEQITERLRAVIDPELRRSIVDLGMVRSKLLAVVTHCRFRNSRIGRPLRVLSLSEGLPGLADLPPEELLLELERAGLCRVEGLPRSPR